MKLFTGSEVVIVYLSASRKYIAIEACFSHHDSNECGNYPRVTRDDLEIRQIAIFFIIYARS